MKLTDFVKLDTKDLEYYYGIEVDKFVVDLPYHLKEIGLVALMEENDSTLSLDVLDVALALNACGVTVILEVPFDFDMPNRDILIMALNCGLPVSIIPPKSNSESDWQLYKEKVLSFTKIWLGQPNAVKPLYPSAGYLQYMIASEFGFKFDTIASDPYMKANFVEGMSIEFMDDLKSDMETIIFEAFGGQDEFKQFAHSSAKAVTMHIENVISH